MASPKGILRSITVLVLILAAGLLGLWFLSGAEIKIKNQDAIIGKIQPKQEQNDQFYDLGGKTPQDTLKLLVLSLEKNDLTLAAKYFISENRETVSEDLTRLDNTNLLGDLLKDLKNIKSGKSKENIHYYFEILDENGQTATELELIKNNNDIWKFISL